MSNKTKIEWTEATWNPVTGCAKVSQGCKNCYALRDWSRLSANPKSVYFGREFTDVQCHPERLAQPLRWKKPRMIFVNSMSDLFHVAVPDEFIDRVFAVMALAPQHTFQILTKRPERMLRYIFSRTNEIRDNIYKSHIGQAMIEASQLRGDVLPGNAPLSLFDGADTVNYATGWPLPNVWLGVSVEDQKAAAERIPYLLDTQAAVRWISAEPLLAEIDITPWAELGGVDTELGLSNPGLDWVVAGGESGPNARPMHPAWARSLRDQCAAANVPFLFKQWGEYTEANDLNIDTAKSNRFIELDGTDSTDWTIDRHSQSTAHMVFVGKKLAGRLLDGKQHDEYPRQILG